MDLLERMLGEQEAAKSQKLEKRFDEIYEIDTIEEVEKFNPYHDRLGRFTSAGNASSFTIRTRAGYQQGQADRAIAREKERAASGQKVKSRGVTMGEPGTGMRITSGKKTKGKVYFVSGEGQYRDFEKPTNTLSNDAVGKLIKDGKAEFLKRSEMDSLRNARNDWNKNKPDYEMGVNGERGKGKTIYRYRNGRTAFG